MSTRVFFFCKHKSNLYKHTGMCTQCIGLWLMITIYLGPSPGTHAACVRAIVRVCVLSCVCVRAIVRACCRACVLSCVLVCARVCVRACVLSWVRAY